MRLSRHRRSLTATAVVALVLTAGACGTSFNAQTNQQYQASIGADDRAADVQVLNGLLVTSEDGSATLSATLINTTDTDQRLSSVSLVGSDGEKFELVSTDADELVIAPREARTLGLIDDDSQRLKSKVYTTTGIEPIGLYYTLTLTFSDASDVEIKIPSVVRNAIYADVALPPGADPSENLKKSGQEAMDKAAEKGSSGGH